MTKVLMYKILYIKTLKNGNVLHKNIISQYLYALFTFNIQSVKIY